MTLLVNQMAQSLASEELRQAMSLVIDRNALAALTESRLVTLATGLIPEGYVTPWAETSARRAAISLTTTRGADGCP